MHRLVVVAMLVSAVAVTTSAVTTGTNAAASPPVGPNARHNILFVLTDDLDLHELQYMPVTRRLIGDHGATFDHYFVSNSLCCPSRVTTLRGQYSHNTGIWTNGGTNGGFERALAEGVEQDTVATHLDADGYRTALIGKYLNGYPNTASITYHPPGWDTFVSPVRGTPYGEYDYSVNDNGRILSFGRRPHAYGTDVYVRRMQHFIRVASREREPFFGYLAVYAPHQPATPAPRDVRKFPHARVPRTAAYNQADVSRMPRFVRELPRFSAGERAAIDELYRLRIRSLQAVDRGVAALVRTLRATHHLDDTYIVFTSDNGFHLGQHRLPAGKQTAYDTDTHVPLLVRGPGIAAGSHLRALAGNVDLAPTFEAMAGTPRARSTDGRSLLPLATGRQNLRAWRAAYLLEHRSETGVDQPSPPRRRSLPLEPPDPDQVGITRRHVWPRVNGRLLEPRDAGVLNRHSPMPDYDGVRTAQFLYVRYADGETELYDTRTDVAEIHNLAGRRPSLERHLATRLDQLRRCHGQGCRIADSSRLSRG